MAGDNPVVVGGFMLRYRFASWISLGFSAPCRNHTINFAPFGRRTRAAARAGYYGALCFNQDSPPVIYFDIDDTLLDYKASQDLAAIEFAKKYSSHIGEPENFPKVWDEITERHMARYLSGELSFQEQRRCRIRESLMLDLSALESDRIFDEYYQIYEESWCLFPDVESALLTLSGHSMGVITNGDKAHQRYKLEKLGILKYFTDVITPACAGAPKPELAIFQLGAVRANKPPSECWYVGDNYRTDYQGARDAGYKSIWLNRYDRQEQCEIQCKDLNGFVLKVLET